MRILIVEDDPELGPHLAEALRRDAYQVELSTDGAEALTRGAEDEFDALVIPGGFAPDKLRRSQAVLDLVRAFDGAGKPIAFICHAGWVPISARILKGRRATSVGAIRDDMVNAGADWVDEATVVDGNLISARTPADLGPWMKALLKALAIG